GGGVVLSGLRAGSPADVLGVVMVRPPWLERPAASGSSARPWPPDVGGQGRETTDDTPTCVGGHEDDFDNQIGRESRGPKIVGRFFGGGSTGIGFQLESGGVSGRWSRRRGGRRAGVRSGRSGRASGGATPRGLSSRRRPRGPGPRSPREVAPAGSGRRAGPASETGRPMRWCRPSACRRRRTRKNRPRAFVPSHDPQGIYPILVGDQIPQRPPLVAGVGQVHDLTVTPGGGQVQPPQGTS